MKSNETEPSHLFAWSLPDVAAALHIDEASVKEYFRDGRRMSFVLERRLQAELGDQGYRPNENASFDVVATDGSKWEVRCLTEGIYFCPSYMVGSGRSFDEVGFLEKLDEIAGYIIGDIKQFPSVPCWTISSELVRQWWEGHRLGSNSRIARTSFYRLIGSEDPLKN